MTSASLRQAWEASQRDCETLRDEKAALEAEVVRLTDRLRCTEHSWHEAERQVADLKEQHVTVRTVTAYEAGYNDAVEEAERKLESVYGTLGKLLARDVRALKTSANIETRRWRHVKRGSTYTELTRATLHAKGPIINGARVVVYRGEHPDGQDWCRPEAEFEDGRFIEIAPANSETETK
jgi:hypothetical protein